MERIKLLKEFHKKRLELIKSRSQIVIQDRAEAQVGDGVITRSQQQKSINPVQGDSNQVLSPQPSTSKQAVNLESGPSKRPMNSNHEEVTVKKQKFETVKSTSRKIVEREKKRQEKLEEKRNASTLGKNQPESPVSSPHWYNPQIEELIEDMPLSPRITIYEDSNLTLFIEKQLFQRQKV